MPKKSDRLN